MNEIQQLVERYDQTMSGDAWYGDPVWRILQGIDARCAAAQLIPGTHTIWQLVMHMEFWERIAARRLSGPATPDEAGNFPATPAPDEAEWQKTLEGFRASNREFRQAISQLDSSSLDSNTAGGQRTFRYELVGVIEHHIYHAGQIALLKKGYSVQPGKV
ncbi:MAG: DinB family protein [Candidatus Korobacteraceae bacterium]